MYKIKFVDSEDELLFWSEMPIIPQKGEGMYFYWPSEFSKNEEPVQNWAEVMQIAYCTDKKNNFSHIEIELDDF